MHARSQRRARGSLMIFIARIVDIKSGVRAATFQTAVQAIISTQLTCKKKAPRYKEISGSRDTGSLVKDLLAANDLCSVEYG